MIDIKLIRDNPDIIRKDLEKRQDTEKLVWIDLIRDMDEEWRRKKKEIDELRKQRNEFSKKIGEAKKKGEDVSELLEKAALIPEEIKNLEEEADSLKSRINEYLMKLPNITHKSVPYGKDGTENQEIKKWGEIEEHDFELKNHGEFLENLGGADFKRAAKISGSGFYFLKGKFALLNQALIRFVIDKMVKKGYLFVQPPHMMRKMPYTGVTDLDSFKDVRYKIDDEDEYLIATSEHPLTAMFMDEVVPEKDLPIKMVGLSHCFRKEIGSHGVDTKGLFRVHQFEKVEQIILCKPEDSWNFHEELLKNAEEIFQDLEIPYRVVNICTGDLGSVAAKKYDIEAWFPRQQKYREVVSCSNCTDYQARRLNIKYGYEGGKKELVHTLNSTAIALGRALVAIVENYQQKGGSLRIPKVLVPYMGGLEEIRP